MVGDECGIVVVGRRHSTGDAYVVEDLSGRLTPAAWAECAVDAARRWSAPVVAETDYGGSMVTRTLETAPGGANLRVVPVTASRSKVDRHKPARRQQGRSVQAMTERRGIPGFGGAWGAEWL